jgi:branched-chain amino acid transport system substrate-binding protein
VTAVILPVLKQLRQSGYTGPVLHSSGVNPDQAQAILGADYNTIMKDNYDCAGTLPTTSAQATTKQFATDYQTRWKEYPQDLTMWAHDLPFVVADTMAKAGSTTDSDKIYKALPEISVPKASISGWVAGEGGKFFTDRDARTSSEVTTWCQDKKTIVSAMVFDVQGGKLTSPTYRDNPCAAAS